MRLWWVILSECTCWAENTCQVFCCYHALAPLNVTYRKTIKQNFTYLQGSASWNFAYQRGKCDQTPQGCCLHLPHPVTSLHHHRYLASECSQGSRRCNGRMRVLMGRMRGENTCRVICEIVSGVQHCDKLFWPLQFLNAGNTSVYMVYTLWTCKTYHTGSYYSHWLHKQQLRYFEPIFVVHSAAAYDMHKTLGT